AAVRQRYDLLGARQYAGLANEAAANRGSAAPYSPADLANLSETNWQDRVFRVAGMQSHNLSVDGLARRSRYYVAADYLQQAGVVRESGLSRYHLRANIDQQLTDKLSVGLRASVGQTTQYYPGTEPDAGRLLQQALLASPTFPPRNAANVPNPRPLAEMDYYTRASRTRRLLAQLSATYQFSPGLSATVRASRQLAVARQREYNPDYATQRPGQAPDVVENGTDSTISRTWVLDAALRYQRTFGTSHVLTASLGYLRQQYERELSQDIHGGSGMYYYASSFSSREKSRPMHSPSACLNYTYDGRYEMQASLRSDFAFSDDGSRSEFRWLPGGHLSWHMHKEAFLANATGLSELTLWAGTGQTSSFFSADRTTHHDAGLLGGHLTLDVAAYQRRTRHAYTLLTLPPPPGNGGGIRYMTPDVTLLNRGLELTLGSTWRVGPLTGTTQLAAATNRNQVETINGGPYYVGAFEFPGLEAGQSLARFQVYEQNGTYPNGSPQAGQMRFRDRNDDGQTSYADAYYADSGLPRYTLNVYQELRLHRFQLAAQLDGLFGYQLLNATLRNLDLPTGTTNSSAHALAYWTPTHQDTNVPRPGSFLSPYLSDQALASGNHVRLSQLTLAYEVLRKETRSVSVWVGGQNLFVTGGYRGFDPNVSSGGAAPFYAGLDASVYPVARVWQLGVHGQF
ncbi:SusC/RagA family TonB-linked outer membrane protein, partial [Hymenobacter agri]